MATLVTPMLVLFDDPDEPFTKTVRRELLRKVPAACVQVFAATDPLAESEFPETLLAACDARKVVVFAGNIRR